MLCCSILNVQCRNPVQGADAVLALVGESVRAELLEQLPALQLGSVSAQNVRKFERIKCPLYCSEPSHRA